MLVLLVFNTRGPCAKLKGDSCAHDALRPSKDDGFLFLTVALSFSFFRMVQLIARDFSLLQFSKIMNCFCTSSMVLRDFVVC